MILFFLFCMLLLLPLNIYGQTSLTWAGNGFREGDSLVMWRIEDISPGPAGKVSIWDFSNTDTCGKHISQHIQYDDTIAVCDGGTSWRTVLRDDTLLLTGYENRYTFIEYDEPLPILRYPISFGDSIRGNFHGKGVWCDRKFMHVWGDCVTRADGEGSLLLPTGDTLKHVLRVHSLHRTWRSDFDTIRVWGSLLKAVRQEDRRDLEMNTSKTTPVVSDTYAWYAPGWRYPVLRIENATDGISSVALAVVYPPESQLDLDYDMENALLRQQLNKDDGQIQSGDQDHTFNAMVSHTTNYNSTTNTITVSFSLSCAAAVSLQLSDAAGIAWRSSEQSYDCEGNYSLTLSCAGLPHGQYALRVNCGMEVITEKFNVK